MVTYKETPPLLVQHDPSSQWTGAWRDPSSPDGSQPENALSGTIFTVDAQQISDPLVVPYAYSQLRFWGNTSVADLQPGQEATLSPILGYEWDFAPDNGFSPAGLVRLSSTTDYIQNELVSSNYGSVATSSGYATHNLTLYRAPSGALVFGAGSIFFPFALNSNHLPHGTEPISPADHDLQQAMVNLFADMGVQPDTLQADLIRATQSTDHTPPTSVITSQSVEELYGNIARVHGTASDLGGVVAAVEVSIDSGTTWHPAFGTTEWTYVWTPRSTDYAVMSRAVDDSLNIQSPGTAVDLSLSDAPQLDQFSGVDGWASNKYIRQLVDLNHDGKLDYLGFGSSKTFVAYGTSDPDGSGYGFDYAGAAISNFGYNQGYKQDYVRGAADTGYGVGDTIYAQGDRGIYWRGATSSTQTTDAAGNSYDALIYETSSHLYAQFGKASGWTSKYEIDVTFLSQGDQYASILGFGFKGIVVAPQAFDPAANSSQAYTIPVAGNKDGWDQRYDVRTFTDSDGKPIDLNHDGIVDFVGMGPNGLVFSDGERDLSGHYSLGPLQVALNSFGRDGGWNNSQYPREIIKDSVTGYYDIVAFGSKGIYVAMGQDPTTHGGDPFAPSYLASSNFGHSEGWNSNTPRIVTDINKDGTPDIVGFGSSATYFALGSRDGNGDLHFTLALDHTLQNFGSAQGWDATTPRMIASNEGHSALVLSGDHATSVWDLMA